MWEDSVPHFIECQPDAWLAKYVRKIGEELLENVATNAVINRVMELLPNGESRVDLLNPPEGDMENVVHNGLVDIFDEICCVAPKIDSSFNQSTVLEFTGSTIYAKAKGNVVKTIEDKFRHTAAAKEVVPLSQEEGPDKLRSTSGIIAIGKVKLEEDAATENDRKLFENAAELIYNDPCRRFIFGFTIQPDQMRLWHFNRSYICRSQRFNIHDKTGRRYLIAFLLLLGFAKHEELGIDPTVTRVEVHSESGPPVIAYRYDVEDQDDANSKSYLTEGPPISESAAYHICSRATRVWKVRQIMSTSDDGEITLSDVYHVLKDVWLYSDSKGEKAIQDDIFRRLGVADKKYGSDHQSEARPYFVTILNDWKVAFEGTSDETPGLPSHWSAASITRPGATFGPVASGSLRAVTPSHDSGQPSTPKTINVDHKHHPRQHYRTVYKEVCKSIYDIEDYEIALQALIGNLLALYYLFIAGYVHRDVSAGNCLWYPEDKFGKLSDLEYARPYDELSGHDPRTGTPAFMAAEYLSGIQLFPVWDGVDLRDANYIKPDLKKSILPKGRTQRSFRPVKEQPPTSSPTEPVMFNFYHDVESTFWIYLWYLVHHFPIALSEGQNKFETLPVMVKPFNGLNASRHALFTSTTKSLEVHSALSVAYTAPFDVLVDVISMVTLLSQHYSALSREGQSHGNLRPHEQFHPTIYTEMMDILQDMLEKIELKKQENVDFSSKRCNPPAAPASKRESQQKARTSEHGLVST